MKRRVIVFAILAALWLASVAAAATFSGKVVGVSDGDTITVLVNRAPVKVRLYGIDCPESHQAYGTQAKNATSALAFGKVVFVEAIDRDRYGRTVGVVTLPGKVNLNQDLVKQGMAWWYRQYAPSSRDLPKLEDQARRAKIGLWSQPNPIPPWDFRKGGSSPAAIAPAPRQQPASGNGQSPVCKKIHAMAAEAFGRGEDSKSEFAALKAQLFGETPIKTTELNTEQANTLIDALSAIIDKNKKETPQQ